MRRLALLATAAIVLGITGVGLERPADVAEADGGVRVLDTGGSQPAPCGPVDVRGGRFVRGGCRTRASDLSMALSIRTAFGETSFGNCVTLFDVTFTADGRMWLDNLRIGGDQPCSDVWPCSPPQVIALRKTPLHAPPLALVPPWRGELLAARGSRFEGHFRFCVDTCAGRYQGDIHVDLVREDDDWVMRARSAGVGATGLEVNADWDMVEPSDFDLKPASG
jgi:hypothetical protein